MIDEVDLRVRVVLSNGAPHVSWAATQVYRPQRSVTRKGNGGADNLQIPVFGRTTLLRPPQVQEILYVILDPCVDLRLVNGWLLHRSASKLWTVKQESQVA